MGHRALALALTLAFVAGACSSGAPAARTIVDGPTHQINLAEQAPAGALVLEQSAASAAPAPPPAAPVADPAPAVRAAGVRADLPQVSHVWQTLNNCGPASVVMALAAFDVAASQEVARLALRGPDLRRGMPSAGVDPWVREQFGLRSVVRTNGTNELMKRLLANGFTPIVTQWLEDPTRIAHDRLVRGYDDSMSAFLVNDPMKGAAVPLSYSWFATNWQAFNYSYFVIYRPEDEALLRAVIGDDWNDRIMRARTYERAKVEARDQDSSAAWLFYGEAAYRFGMFEEAVAAFETGMSRGSPFGVFTVRSSYPLALLATGRAADSDAAAGRLANSSSTPFVRPTAVDPLALTLAAERLAERAAAAVAPSTATIN
ncbi:MAG: hypothetical protein ABR525_03395 [Candidatus Limnocylindria bacterium]